MFSQACPPIACTIASSAARACFAFFAAESSAFCARDIGVPASISNTTATGKTLCMNPLL
jgi:hypothetical protein